MMWYWGNTVHWWEWLLGFVGMVAFWGLVIWGIWYLVTGLTRATDRGLDQRGEAAPPPAGPPHSGGPQARHILDERLARGEIDAEEYRHLRDLITGADRAPAGPAPDGDRVASPR